MASNTFGNIFRITTWGESHGPAMGVVIDGCPPGLPINEEEINSALEKRQGGSSPYVTQRKEPDRAGIYSGVFEGKTTGAPLSLIIFNHNIDSTSYEPIKDLLRPGHANFTYLKKYGIFDYRGGGRASARETVCRVAAGVIAKKLLAIFGIQVVAYIYEIGGIALDNSQDFACETLREQIEKSPIFCPNLDTTEKILRALLKVKEEGDSLGGIVECCAFNMPVGLGDPVYEKLEANLAKAMLTIPATKGFEIGSGFAGAKMQGSEHNDLFVQDQKGALRLATNHSGGTLGGISTGEILRMRVAFKPTSSIKKPQSSLNLEGEKASFQIPENARHDPCVAIRAVPVVEAMTAITLADSLLMHSCLERVAKI